MTVRDTRPGWPSQHAEPAELRPGTRVARGRFLIEGELGRGGMATVYRAVDQWSRGDRGDGSAPRSVALKVMHPQQAERSARRIRFAEEARLTAALPRHPTLVRWVAHGALPELGGRPYLCTARVCGPTLAYHLATRVEPPPPGSPLDPRAMALAGALAAGVARLHARSIVHRDLTARNVVLCGPESRPTPVVVDFGLALRLDANVLRLTQGDQRPGTWSAMAPEQLGGAPPHTSMDVYALARLLVLLFGADDPHRDCSPQELAQAYSRAARVAPRYHDRQPTPLWRLLDRCFDPRPGERPTAAAVARALRPPPRPTFEPRVVVESSAVAVSATRPRKRSWWRGYAVATVVVATVVVAAWGGWWHRRPDTRATAPTMPASVVLPEPSWAWPATIIPWARRATAMSPAAVPAPGRFATDPSSTPSCAHRRRAALRAAAAWRWREVLRHTSMARCWGQPRDRIGLRIDAWTELGQFERCAAEGRGVPLGPRIARARAGCVARMGNDRGEASG